MEFAFLMKPVKLALVVFAIVPLLAAKADGPTTGVSDLDRLARDSNYTDVSDIPNVHVQLRYASENNFLKKNLYGDVHRCFLHRTAAAKLRVAAVDLEEIRPGWKLLIFDCLRPRWLQEKLYAAVKVGSTIRIAKVRCPRRS
jgi:zinc D-Ala-D-Ala dipeptidase